MVEINGLDRQFLILIVPPIKDLAAGPISIVPIEAMTVRLKLQFWSQIMT